MDATKKLPLTSQPRGISSSPLTRGLRLSILVCWVICAVDICLKPRFAVSTQVLYVRAIQRARGHIQRARRQAAPLGVLCVRH
jgi:hypothetical protein